MTDKVSDDDLRVIAFKESEVCSMARELLTLRRREREATMSDATPPAAIALYWQQERIKELTAAIAAKDAENERLRAAIKRIWRAPRLSAVQVILLELRGELATAETGVKP